MIQIQVSHTWESSVPVYKDWESAVLDSCLGFLWLFVSYKKKRNFLTGSSLCVVVWSWIWGSSVLRSLNLFKVLDTFPIFPHWKKNVYTTFCFENQSDFLYGMKNILSFIFIWGSVKCWHPMSKPTTSLSTLTLIELAAYLIHLDI